MTIAEAGNITWGLIQIFGPLIVVLFIVSSAPVTQLYARYLHWVDGRFKASRERSAAELAALDAKHHTEIADIKFEHFDIWYNGWQESFAPELMPVSRFRNVHYLQEFSQSIDAASGDLVFTHPDTTTTRRYPLTTLDMDK